MGIQSYGTIAFAIMTLNPIMNVIVMIYRQRLAPFYANFIQFLSARNLYMKKIVSNLKVQSSNFKLVLLMIRILANLMIRMQSTYND